MSLRFLNRQFWIVIALAIFGGMCGLSRPLITVILIAEIVLMRFKYRCPFCKKNFDIRTKLSELSYCPNCGAELNK